jgi:hypothetical protein
MDKDQLLLEQAYDRVNTSVTVYGLNYTGAHFRGLADDLDQREVKAVVRGSQQGIVTWILENFSYGQDEPPIETIAEMVKGYKEFSISNGDGCGILMLLLDASNKILFDERSVYNVPFDPNRYIDLGVIDADNIDTSDVNHMLAQLKKQGKLPDRVEGDDDVPSNDLDENDDMDTDY